ncbi:MAG: hypothetical protein JSR73_09405 [Proteobacteria bacterium]|nr:hypothetical protein [Pseudomonadota bacterium]
MTIDALPGATTDIAELRLSDPDELADILAFLEEASADPDLIDKFTSRGDVRIAGRTVNVKPWVLARRTDNLFRIRILDPPIATGFRIVYGYDWRLRRIGILAIVRRNLFDYERDSPLAERIFNDWRSATAGQAT